jgi:hypothetical protein
MFLKLQEAAISKQAEAKRQGYDGNTINAPTKDQQVNNGASQGQDHPNQGHDNDGGYVPSKGHITAMIQLVPKLNKEEKSITRQVNLAVTSPPATMEYLHWSEQPIEFNRDDHPIRVPRPGNAPLVLKAQIGTYDVDRLFMDAGSGINLIYAKTLRAMHISLEFLKPTDCSFHGIIPGSANYPLGQVALNVCFGNAKTIEERSSTSKSWTGHHNITRSSGDPHFRDSWQFLTIHTWYSRCQDPMELSR